MPTLDNKVVSQMTIYLDESSHNSPAYIYAKQNDSKSRYLKVKLMSQAGQYMVESTSQLNAVRPDGTHIYLPGIRNDDGTVTFELTANLLFEVGNVQCDISIFDTEDNEQVQLTSSSFCIIVDKANYDADAIEGSGEYSLVTEALAQLQSDRERAEAAADAFNLEVGDIYAAIDDKADRDATENALDALENDVTNVYGAIGEKGDNLWFNEEDGKLYLMSDGEPIGDGVTVATSGGGGGGGGGSSNEYTITLTNLLPTRLLTVAAGATVNLQFSYASVAEDESDDGAGVGTITVNSVVKGTATIPQGNNVLDITECLSSGTNNVKIKVMNSEGTTKTLTYTVTVITLSISTTFQQMGTYNGSVNFSYTPSGTGEKTIHFVMDDVELSTATVTSNNRSQTFTIPAQAHGAHIFKCYATMTVDGVNVTSNVITIGMMWIDESSTTPIVLSPFDVTSVTQGENIIIPFMVYDPTTENAEVVRKVLNSDDSVFSQSTVTVSRTPQSWAVNDYPVGNVKFVISCGTASVTLPVTVAESSLVIEPVTDSLILEFTAAGRSNNEANPESWSYGEPPNQITASFTGFGWTGADGWVDDSDGNTALRFLPNDFMTIPFYPFASDARTTGFTIEAEFATRDVQDYDSIVLSCFADGRGFRIGSQYAELKSEQSEVAMQFKEDSHVRVAFVVENRNQNRLVYIYINGVMCGVSQYPANDDFSQPSPVGLTIGAESCGIDLYRIRIYDKGLTRSEQLDNFIYDRPTFSQKVDAYNRNNVLNAGEEVDITKLPPTLPYMIIACPELPQYKGDKKTGVTVTYVNPADTSKSFTATGVEMDVQGTSSAGYPVKNYKEKYKSGITYTASGETASKYKLRSSSIPVSTFCLKADFASSENANNVKLVDCYEAHCPYLTPPQQVDSKVRQGIDGLPMVVFWQDANNDIHFIGKYNFNNDKSTADVFGLTSAYPHAESWEFRNNTSNRCLLKESDYTGNDWLNDFEARYPEDNTNFTQLKRVTDWLVTTDRTAATNNNLSESVTIDGTTYTKDTAAYRLAKFKSEFETYFIKSATLFYYLFTEVFLMIDSRAKNMFLTTYDGTHWLPLPYDFDTALGINNEGVLVFDYDLEDTDRVDNANVFNGQTSVLWCNVRDAFGGDIKTMYKDLRSRDSSTFSYQNVKRIFDEHQSVWPEAIWNEDAFVKYLQPYLIQGENYLSMLQGSKESQRDWWLFNAFKYRDSKYQAGDALRNFITLRCYALGNITVTPYSHIYPTVKYGSYTVTTRGKRNTAYTLVNPMDQMNDTEVYIYSADRISSVGDLSGLQVGYANFSMATKLQNLKLGDDDSGYENTNLKELYVGNNELLKTLDVTNCSALGTDQQKSVDLSGCSSLESVFAEGTALSGLELPNGGHLKTLKLPGTITNFTIQNQKNLTTLSFEDLSALTTLRVENTPNVDIATIVDEATNLNRVRLVDVAWEEENEAALIATINKLKTCIGMDASGNNTAKAVVTGVVEVPSITDSTFLSINEEFPELSVSVNGQVSHVVRFMNEAVVYDTQIVAHGAAATAPATPPTKEPTAQYTYTFAGWDRDFSNVTSSMIVYATFNPTTRRYTVRFYNGSTLLQEVYNVLYGGTATYTGSTPTHSDPDYAFTGFSPTGSNITGDTNCYAVFVDTNPPLVRYINGSMAEYVSGDEATEIGSYAFASRTSLQTVQTKADIIRDKAFDQTSGNRELAVVDMGSAGVPYIGKSAFGKAYKLSHLIIRSPYVGTIYSASTKGIVISDDALVYTPMFAGCGAIYVPANLVANYKASPSWLLYASQIHSIDEYPLSDFSSITDSWDDIFASEANGTYSSRYSIGDTKRLTINIDGQSRDVYMQIAAFDSDVLSDNSGHAKITWICKAACSSRKANSTSTNAGGWVDSDLRAWLRDTVITTFPSNVLGAVKSVAKTYYDVGTASTLTSTETIWIPSLREMGDATWSGAARTVEDSGVVYSEIFTSDNTGTRAKSSYPSNTVVPSAWWLRTSTDSNNFWSIGNTGNRQGNSANSTLNVVFGFCT